MEDSDEVNIPPVDVILFGLGRYGGSLLVYLQEEGLLVLGVDFDPELVRNWRKKRVLAFYGDAENPEFASTLPLHEAKWVVSTLPRQNIGLTLLHTLQHRQCQGQIALTTHTHRKMKILKEAGADLGLSPFREAAREASKTLLKEF